MQPEHYKYLTAIIACLLAIILISAQIQLLSKSGELRPYREIIKQLLPNLIASLIVFLTLYIFIDRVIDEKSLSRHEGIQSFSGVELRELLEKSNLEQLNKISLRLKEQRSIIRADIQNIISSIAKADSDEQKQRLEGHLSSIYRSLGIIERRIEALDGAALVSKELRNKDFQITLLEDKVLKLTEALKQNKNSAVEIVNRSDSARP